GLKETYKTYKEVKDLPPYVIDPKKEAVKKVLEHGKGGGGGVIEGGKGAKDVLEKAGELKPGGPGEVLDPTTMLPDANAAAINAGNAALDALVEGQIQYNLVGVHQTYRKGALDFAQMIAGVSQLNAENKAMPDASVKQLNAVIKECEGAQKLALVSLKRLQAVWDAYG